MVPVKAWVVLTQSLLKFVLHKIAEQFNELSLTWLTQNEELFPYFSLHWSSGVYHSPRFDGVVDEMQVNTAVVNVETVVEVLVVDDVDIVVEVLVVDDVDIVVEILVVDDVDIVVEVLVVVDVEHKQTYPFVPLLWQILTSSQGFGKQGFSVKKFLIFLGIKYLKQYKL